MSGRRRRATPTVLAFDIGGTWIRGAIAGRVGPILAEGSTSMPADPDGFLHAVRALADELAGLAGAPITELRAAGIGLPVVIEPRTGSLASTHNAPALEAIPDLANALARTLGVPVALENDANLAALAEARLGAGAGLDPVVVVAIGTGIGMGTVAGGRILRGAHGAAGELGFLPLGADPWAVGSRRSGALELAAAGPAIRHRIDTAVRAARDGGTWTRLAPESDLAAVADAAAVGDGLAGRLLDEVARPLALGLAAVAALIDPSVILLSGGVGSVPALLPPLRLALARLVPRPPDVRMGALGARAPLEGALLIGRDLAADRQRARRPRPRGADDA